MKIIKGTEPIPVEHPVFALFGQPGIGKSSLGYSTKDPLTLDFDKGAHRAANRRDTLVINTWDDVNELMANTATLDPYATVVVDTVGRCLDMMTADIISSNPKMGTAGNLSLQGYGVLKARFRTWVAQLRTLGKDVLLIAHDTEESDGDSKIVRPDITGGSYGEVMKVADFVGYVYMNGRDRILDFNPTHKWVGKNPGGWKPFVLPPVAKSQDFMAELMKLGREALGAISEESSKVMQRVDEWRLQIETFTTAEECNRAIPEIKKLSAIEQPQVSKILLDHATAKGIGFDKAKKQFVQPEPVGA
jgi:hypothetical protein